MVPGTWLSVLFFFLFVAPGATFELRSRRRRATYEDSTFLEISRIVLASLVFSGLALAVLAVVRELRPAWLPEPRQLVARDPGGYFQDHYVLVLRALIAWSAIACAAAWVANWLLEKSRGGATIRPQSAWTQVFKRDVPADNEAYVRVRLDNGAVYSGRVANFSSDLDSEGRELVLAQPLASKTGTGQSDLQPVPAQYERVIIRGDSIIVLSVEYRPKTDLPQPPRKRLLAWASSFLRNIRATTGRRRRPPA